MSTPDRSDVEAAYIFACACQDALSVFVDRDDPLELFAAIHRALRASPDVLSAMYMTGIANAIVGLGRQVVRYAGDIRLDDDVGLSSTGDRVRSALCRLLAWHQRPGLSLTDVADSLGVSARYLSESINRLSHRGFLDHLHAIRVLHAAFALVDTDDSVESVARRAGYLTSPHFTRQFHRVLHVTPARFRIVARAGRIAIQRNLR